MNKKIITTSEAPSAIGTYSQAVAVGDLLFISGQIGLNPKTGEMVSDDFSLQAEQVLRNLQAVCVAANTDLNATVKFVVYLTDLTQFAILNDCMASVLKAPYPARAAVEVSALPKGAVVEMDAIVSLAHSL